MSVIALVGGTGLYLLFGARLNDFSQSPIIGHFKGRRTFEIVLAAIIDGARVVHRLSGTKRLQVQLRLLVVMVVIVGVLPFLDHGYSSGPRPGTLVDPGFAKIGRASRGDIVWQCV